MDGGIGGIIHDQNRLQRLISSIGSSKPAQAGQPSSRSPLLPCDVGLYRIQVADLLNESTTVSGVNDLADLAKKYGEDVYYRTLSKSRRYRSSLLQLCPTTYPKQVKLCPAMEDIKTRMSQELFILSVFTYSGYSFAAEYTHVYKGKFNKSSALNDCIIMMQRALRVCNPTISDKNCNKYAEFMVRMSAWEATLSASVLEETCKALFPQWKSYLSPVQPENDFQHAEVYIGYNTSGELSFTVRVRNEVELKAVQEKTDKAGAAKANAKAPTSSAEALSPDVALEFIYYREFVLSDAVIDAFTPASLTAGSASARGGSKFVPPPPPPKRSKKAGTADADGDDDIRIFLLLTRKAEVPAQQPPAGAAVDDTVTDNQVNEESALSKADGDIDEAEAWVTALQAKSMDSKVSFCAELYGWGFDASHSLGLGAENDAKTARKTANADATKTAGPSGEAQPEEDLQDHVHGPRRIPLDRMISIERVRMIVCSSNHTLLLTCMGTVFGCGENSEGALGTGDFVSRVSMTPVDWPATAAGGVGGIVKIAAGSSAIGAHSMAIDRTGVLYGWGVAYAVGVGQIKAITAPTVVPVGAVRNPLYAEYSAEARQRAVDAAALEGPIEEDADFLEDVLDGEGSEAVPTRRSKLTAAQRREVVDVACGGGFTVCVTRAGHVYSWGTWAHGRLGLGPVPIMKKLRGPYRGTGTKVARYQLHPERIAGVEGAVAVSCGEAHSLCLLRNGCVLAWGQNSCGQIGSGPSTLGMLSDAYRPVLIPHFGSLGADCVRDYNVGRFAMRNGNDIYKAKLDQLLTTPSGSSAQVRMVQCGAFHSVCVDDRGLVYTWGARGSPCLGHNDAPIVGEWNRRINAIFSISSTENKTMVPFELYGWCATWSMPRVVQALAGGPLQSAGGAGYVQDDLSVGGTSVGGQTASSEVHISAKQRVVQVCAGDLSTAFLTADGKFFLCGTGPAVPNFLPASRTLRDIDPAQDGNADTEDDDAADVSGRATIVANPRCPSDSWLREMCTRKVASIAGGGNRLFVLVDEEVISHTLTAPLLNTLYSTQEERAKSSSGHSVSDHDSSAESIFENRGKADCMILASGKVFLCHKALLAQRSPELRDMIIMESPTDNSTGQLVQLLLPELQRDAARALMHFLYRDVLPAWCIGSTSLLTALARTGKTLRMPRLQILCDRFLRLLRASDSGDASAIADLELPPPTLARDLSALVGDPEFADVRFIAEGRAIVAHRFILEARCAYFRGMFRSGMAEAGDMHRAGEMVDVVVPDTFVGFLRLLIFLYTSTLPDGSDGALLEDLMAADRYVIPDMKLLCENMLVPSESNWLDLLRAAQLLNSLRLELQVMAFLKVNFSVLKGLYEQGDAAEGKKDDPDAADDDTIQYSTVADFQEEFPGLLENLLSARKMIFPLPPSQLVIQQSTENNAAIAQARSKDKLPVFPMWALVVAAVSLFLYQHVSKIVALGPIIPIVNGVGFVAFLTMAIRFFAK